MTGTFVFEEATELVSEGEYMAKPINMYERTGPHSEMIHIDFRLLPEDDYDGCVVSGIASMKFAENTKLGRWVAAILGRMPGVGEEVAFDDLLHKECRVVIKHRKDAEDRVYANVVRVLPANAASQPG